MAEPGFDLKLINSINGEPAGRIPGKCDLCMLRALYALMTLFFTSMLQARMTSPILEMKYLHLHK